MTIDNVKSYTEAQHTVYANVSGEEPMTAGSRTFTPGRITVKYNWRTQLGDEGWTIGNIEVSGLWDDPENGAGSGMVILGMHNAPEWVKEFAEANMPTSALV